MSDDDVTEADFDSVMARAFGRPDPANVTLFREAGFDEAAAQHGAKLMESGAFFGFEDVATTMMLHPRDDANRLMHPNVTAASIAEVAKRSPAVEMGESPEPKPQGGSVPSPKVQETVQELLTASVGPDAAAKMNAIVERLFQGNATSSEADVDKILDSAFGRDQS